MSEEKKQKEKGSSQLFLIKPENFQKINFKTLNFSDFFFKLVKNIFLLNNAY